MQRRELCDHNVAKSPRMRCLVPNVPVNSGTLPETQRGPEANGSEPSRGSRVHILGSSNVNFPFHCFSV